MNRNDEKRSETDILVKSPFLTKLDNFWYHYKWVVIVVSFFVVISVICFVQCATKPTADMTVVFAGGNTLTAEQQKMITDVFDSIAPKDEEGGRMSTILNAHSVYTDAEIEAVCKDEDGKLSISAFNNMKQVSNNHLEVFGTQVMSGESGIWLVSEYVYQQKNLKKLARPLSELYETAPTNAYDAYAIRLKDTSIYQYYEVLQVLPEDTLLVMSAQLVTPGLSDDAVYNTYLELYRAIVGFQAP